ncbi:hypothetical protein HQQ80_11190 [Microbacteriaceae bacterium VKM Ac-2855]|nr:hypothetical protein [Microbacteriaceae bacterium VKM Ac-2855]
MRKATNGPKTTIANTTAAITPAMTIARPDDVGDTGSTTGPASGATRRRGGIGGPGDLTRCVESSATCPPPMTCTG